MEPGGTGATGASGDAVPEPPGDGPSHWPPPASAIVPFYGFVTALPMGGVALGLGIAARRRPHESRHQSLVAIITGGLALLGVIGWVLVIGVLGWGRASSRSVSSSLSVPGSGEVARPVEVEEHVSGSGHAVVRVDDDTIELRLTRCNVTTTSDAGISIEGSGPDGALTLAPGATVTDVLTVTLADDLPRYYDVDARSSEWTSGSDEIALALEGTGVRLDDDAGTVDLSLEVDCG